LKEIYVQFAKYKQEADKTVFALLDKLGNDGREAERGSYYGSLSAVLRHCAGGTCFFAGLFVEATANNAAAQKALSPLVGMQKFPEGSLTPDQWAAFGKTLEVIDRALVDFAAALSDADLSLPVKVPFWGGKPESAPLSFMMSNLIMHGTHHRGQVSQILDELKIDNDYAGMRGLLI
jgi:uncharacterized damage-inducible protein DinB